MKILGFSKAIGVFDSPLLSIWQFEHSVHIFRGPCLLLPVFTIYTLEFTADLRIFFFVIFSFQSYYGLGAVWIPGLSSMGVPGVPWHPRILVDQLTLSQPRGAGYANQILQAPPDFQALQRPCTTYMPNAAAIEQL